MKRNLLSLFSLLFLLGLVSLTSCKKEETTAGGKQFRAVMEDCTDIHNAKTVLNGTALEWVSGDRVHVMGNSTIGVYTATPQSPATTAVLTLAEGRGVEDGTYLAYYPAEIYYDFQTVTLPAVQTSADGSLRGFPMFCYSTTDELQFKNLCGVLKLNLQKPGTTVTSISVTANTFINGRFTINGMFDNQPGLEYYSYSSTGTNTTTLECSQSIATAHDFYIYLPAGSYTGLQITINTADGMTCTKTANRAISVTRSQYTTVTLGSNDLNFVSLQPEGALTGLFTINADGDQVCFSQGNLQYQASTNTWRFAEHQYDYVGSDNSNISATYSGWIDLFGWGTGNNPTLHTTNYTNYTTFVDWGSNSINNGGEVINEWRTLNQAEWSYLFNTRSNTSNLGTDDARYAKGKVNNVQGVILFPDGYTHPTGVAVPTGINNGASGYTTNYPLTDWAMMEAAGAVFLPAAGYRNGTNVYDPGSDGYYWSSGTRNTASAYGMSFVSTDFYFMLSFNRNYGLSVRLVRDND